jgi:hypothetical protein
MRRDGSDSDTGVKEESGCSGGRHSRVSNTMAAHIRFGFVIIVHELTS